MSDQASPSSVPASRGFQFNSGSTGIKNNVNLFRGDVNRTQTLFSMPGLKDGDGLGVDLSLLYQSNVDSTARLFNRDSPTSVVGLGWTLPGNSIVRQDDGVLPAGARYALVSNGGANTLARESMRKRLFALTAAEVGDLVSGERASSELCEAFGQRGLFLSEEALLVDGEVVESNALEINDYTEHRQYLLVPAGVGSWEVFRGGESYQLEGYQFWQIHYYPGAHDQCGNWESWERWEVIDDAGVRSSYGGRLVSQDEDTACASSKGNSVEWKVAWRDDDDGVMWSGPSAGVSRQVQVARAWHLESKHNLWGSGIHFAYNEQWPVDDATGVRPVVEQLVSDQGGLPYTKQCYLTSITDVQGRVARLSYQDKLWSETQTDSAREYADPHKEVPDNVANGWQDLYETQFLSEVEVSSPAGELLFSVALDYLPAPGTEEPAVVVLNNEAEGSLVGDCAKRLLTSVIYRNRFGTSQPPVLFDYYYDASEDGSSVGALRSVISDEGGTLAWAYQEQELEICERNLEIQAPTGVGVNLIPRVWYGNDYAVILWSDALTGVLTLEVATWVGRWLSWVPAWGQILATEPSGIDLSKLAVVVSDDFFAVTYESGNLFKGYLFQADYNARGCWLPAEVDGVTTGEDQPVFEYACGNGAVTCEAGDPFFVISYPTSIDGGACDCITWDWNTREWRCETPVTRDELMRICVGSTFFAVLDQEKQCSLFLLSSDGRWRGAGGWVLDQLITISGAQLVAGENMIAITEQAGTSGDYQDYSLYLLQWNSEGASQDSFYAYQRDSLMVSLIPSVKADSFVGVGGRLWRYDGEAWALNEALYLEVPQSGFEQRFAYGNDYAIRVYVDQNGLVAPDGVKVISAPATASAAEWPSVSAVTCEEDFGTEKVYPAADGGDYLLIGSRLYFRSGTPEWGQVIEEGQPQNLNQLLGENQELDTSSGVNQGPLFTAFNIASDSGSEPEVIAMVLVNGRAIALEDVGGDKRLVRPEDSDYGVPGVGSSGPGTLMSFSKDELNFSRATQFTLFRYAGNDLSGAVRHYGVSQFITDDGVSGATMTAVRLDPASASCDSSGRWMKYYHTQLVPGLLVGKDDPSTTPYGVVQCRYYNSVARDSRGKLGNDHLDGMLMEASVHGADGALRSRSVCRWATYDAITPDPGNAPEVSAFLKGGFSVRTGMTLVKDGVTSEKTQSYLTGEISEPFGMTAIRSTTSGIGAEGLGEYKTQEQVFAIQLTEGISGGVFQALNLVSQTLQTLQKWQVEGGEELTVASSARTWGKWVTQETGVSVPALSQQYLWRGRGSALFPYSGSTTGQGGDLPGWKYQQAIVGRLNNGLMSEAANAMGTPFSMRYDASGAYPLASIAGASNQGDDWRSQTFEHGEVPEGWEFSQKDIVRGDCYVGNQSLSLVGGASLTTSVQPDPGGGRYQVCYALRTPAGFQPERGTGWTMSFSGDDTREPVFEPLPASSDGKWQYFSFAIALPLSAELGELTLTLVNTNQEAVLVDVVSLVPGLSSSSCYSYDPLMKHLTSSMAQGGVFSRGVVDDFGQAFLSLDPREQLRQLGGTGLSRMVDLAQGMSSSDPNATLKIIPADYGAGEAFYRGDDWRDHWQEGATGSWFHTPGKLSCGPDGGRLNWAGWATEKSPQTAVLGVLMSGGTSVGAAVPSLEFLEDYRISWQPSEGWVFEGPEEWNPSPIEIISQCPEAWTLVFGDGVLAFFAGHRLVFSEAWDLGVPADLVLSAEGVLDLSALAFAGGPRVSVSYFDGLGNALQGQSLEKADAGIGASLTDPLRRTVATTKIAPASFQNPDDRPLLAYRDDFVDREAFQDNFVDSWLMEGLVADYYRGEDIDGVTTSDDGGYPYVGTRYDAAPGQRLMESGLPGWETAIRNITQPVDSRETTSYAYGTNEEIPSFLSDNGVLPAASFYQQIMRSPLGNATLKWNDYSREQVASALLGTGQEKTHETRETHTWADGEHGVMGERDYYTPNHFNGDDTTFIDQLRQSVTGDLSRIDVPGIGVGTSLRDVLGNLRVLGIEGEDQLRYFCYDRLNRPTEIGILSRLDDWSNEKLELALQDPLWPIGVDSREVIRSWKYDGDGTSPVALGLKDTVTSNPSGGIPVEESFQYDDRGRIREVIQRVASEGYLARFGYHYTNADEISLLEYPAQSPVEKIFYGYDEAGRVISIGTGEGEIASYSYAPNGDLQEEILQGGLLSLKTGLTSQSWLQSYTVTLGGAEAPFWSQVYETCSNSTVKSRVDTTAEPLVEGMTELVFTYSPQQELQDATATGASPWVETISEVDANGNILVASLNEEELTVTRDPASDKIASFTLGDQPAETPGYTPTGFLRELGPVTVEYDPILLLPSSWTTGNGEQTTLGYGNGGQRLVKQTSLVSGGMMTTYFSGGVASRPLLIQDGEAGVARALIYGPSGLVSARTTDQSYYPIKDNLQSIRKIIDGTGAVVAEFDYSAFGSIISEEGSMTDLLPMRFMGQMYDEETGFHDFKARLYDSVLRRFHGPDPARQYPSPYVFVGNQPISNRDDDGEMAWFALMGMSAVAGAGLALSVFTFGTSDEAAAAIDATIAGAVAVDAAEAAAEGGEAAVGVGEAAAEGSEAVAGGAAEVESGITEASAEEVVSESAAEESTAAGGEATSTVADAGGEGVSGKLRGAVKKAKGWNDKPANWSHNLVHVGIKVVSGSFISSSENGAMYILKNPNSFSLSDLTYAMARGALSGAISGAALSLVNLPTTTAYLRREVKSKVRQSLIIAASKGVVGFGVAEVTSLVTDKISGQQPSIKELVGSVVSGASSAGSSAAGDWFSTWSNESKSATYATGAALGVAAEMGMLILGVREQTSSSS